MRRTMHGLLALTLGLTLAACGGGAEEGGGTAEGGEGEVGTSLSMIDNAFEPAQLTVAAGSEVEVTNDGEALHNITVEGTDLDEDVDAGGSTTVSVDAEPGTYTMFCEYHRAGGMEGTVTIQ